MTRSRKLLAALYLAGVALLAWAVPHRPAVSFSAGDWYSGLIGFSPDGTLLATATRDPLDAAEYDVRLWDFAGRPWFGPPRLAAERHFDRLAQLGWGWPDDPGRRWLFWECCAAADPQARADELYPGVALDAERLDPTENPPRFRASADGRYYLLRVPTRRFEVREQAGGRVLWTTPQVATTPVFGPGPDELTVLEPPGNDGLASVVRYELPSGRATLRAAFAVPKPPAGARLTRDGRRVETGSASFDVASGGRFAAAGDMAVLHWLDPPGRYVGVEQDNAKRSMKFFARVWDPSRDVPVAEVHSSGLGDAMVTLAGATPDGSAFALRSWDRSGIWPAGWPRWLAQIYLKTVGRSALGSMQVTLYATADGRELGIIPYSGSGNRATGEGAAAFAPDGRWLAVPEGQPIFRGGRADGGRVVVSVYELPLRRPWAWILAWAAAPPVALALSVAAVRRLRRGRR